MAGRAGLKKCSLYYTVKLINGKLMRWSFILQDVAEEKFKSEGGIHVISQINWRYDVVHI